MVAKNLILINLFCFLLLLSCAKDNTFDFYSYYSTQNTTTKTGFVKKKNHILFAQNYDKKICLIDDFDVFQNYKKGKTNINIKYDSYFNDVLSGNTLIYIDTNYYICFELDENIDKNFKDLNIKNFLSKYTKKSGAEKYILINNSFTDEVILSVAYCLFKVGYEIIFDDYIGCYYAIKIKDL